MQMFRYFLVFLLISLAGEAFPQIDLQRYTTATDTFYWKKYQHIPKPAKLNLKQFVKAGSRKVTESFLARNILQFPQFTNDSNPKYGLNDLKKSLFAMDLNGDRKPDIIFSGFSGGESDMVRIFINRGDSFELVFEDYQYITQMVMEKGNLVRLQTGDVGCCDAYLYFTRDYKTTSESGKLAFVKGKQTVAYCYTEEPVLWYPQPEAFTTIADTMMVRASAAQLNEPFNPHLDTFGNIIGKYRSKARGVVLAKKSGTHGNDWYYVEIYPDVSPSVSILYDIGKIPTFIRGWVSGQAIMIK